MRLALALSLERLDRFSAPPFLIAHGTHDSLFPLCESQRFARALKLRHIPIVWRLMDGTGHVFEGSRFPQQRSLELASYRFIREIAMGGAPPRDSLTLRHGEDGEPRGSCVHGENCTIGDAGSVISD